MAKVKRWKHNLPFVNGQPIIIDSQKLTEALELMWTDQIDPHPEAKFASLNFNSSTGKISGASFCLNTPPRNSPKKLRFK